MARLINGPEKKSILLALIVVFCLTASNFSALAQYMVGPLSQSEIEQFIFGRSMTGEYSNGEPWSEQFHRDGTSLYIHRGQYLPGQMTLNGNILCFIYANEADGGCFEVWKQGPNCFSFYGSGSTATQDQRQSGRAWDARGWYNNQPATCVGDQISLKPDIQRSPNTALPTLT